MNPSHLRSTTVTLESETVPEDLPTLIEYAVGLDRLAKATGVLLDRCKDVLRERARAETGGAKTAVLEAAKGTATVTFPEPGLQALDVKTYDSVPDYLTPLFCRVYAYAPVKSWKEVFASLKDPQKEVGLSVLKWSSATPAVKLSPK